MKHLIMLGTSFGTMGGISSVVNVYRSAGLFSSFPIRYIATHCDGGGGAKLAIFVRAFSSFFINLLLGRIGLLHVHVSSRASFWRKMFFFLPAFLFRIPTILHLHGSEFAVFYEKECGIVRKYLVRFVFDRADRVVVLSSAWKEWVVSISRNSHVEAIYNPVLLPERKYPWSERMSNVVLFLGRLGKRKGSYDLLDAAAIVVKRLPYLKLRLGGDGELKETNEHAQQLGISGHVHLLGWVRGEDKDVQLGQSTICALPSYNEGLPMTILEAMAAGLPILSTPIGGIPEAVSDGIEGFLVQPGDVGAIADRLEQLLIEPGLAERMGAAARAKVEGTFSANVILPKVEAMYLELGFCR